jgi:hypothetical protein
LTSIPEIIMLVHPGISPALKFDQYFEASFTPSEQTKLLSVTVDIAIEVERKGLCRPEKDRIAMQRADDRMAMAMAMAMAISFFLKRRKDRGGKAPCPTFSECKYFLFY